MLAWWLMLDRTGTDWLAGLWSPLSLLMSVAAFALGYTYTGKAVQSASDEARLQRRRTTFLGLWIGFTIVFYGVAVWIDVSIGAIGLPIVTGLVALVLSVALVRFRAGGWVTGYSGKDI